MSKFGHREKIFAHRRDVQDSGKVKGNRRNRQRHRTCVPYRKKLTIGKHHFIRAIIFRLRIKGMSITHHVVSNASIMIPDCVRSLRELHTSKRISKIRL